jgi:hypothetical protein
VSIYVGQCFQIECKIQVEDVDTWFTQNPKLATLDVCFHQAFDGILERFLAAAKLAGVVIADGIVSGRRTRKLCRESSPWKDPDDAGPVYAVRLDEMQEAQGPISRRSELPREWCRNCGWRCENLSCHTFPSLFGMYGGDDGARTRDLCRDRAAL